MSGEGAYVNGARWNSPERYAGGTAGAEQLIDPHLVWPVTRWLRPFPAIRECSRQRAQESWRCLNEQRQANADRLEPAARGVDGLSYSSEGVSEE